MTTRYVIIGDGAAGTSAAFYIRRLDPQGVIQILSNDSNPAYYRAALTNYLLGELQPEQLFAVPPDFYKTFAVDRIFGEVKRLDPEDKRLVLSDNRRLLYDRLLIASGSRPNLPDFPNADLRGVMTMRTLKDARRIMDLVSGKTPLRQAVIVGGGPLGIEWVQALLHHKVQVTYLIKEATFFGHVLDQIASDLVLSRLRAAGVDVRTNAEIKEALANRDGAVRAVRLVKSDDTIDCQLLGVAIGTRPNVEFLRGAGLNIPINEKYKTPQGITVDDKMRTNLPYIYAAGDVTDTRARLWEPARRQGQVAGTNMAGGDLSYQPGELYNATRLYDLDLASIGKVNKLEPTDLVLEDLPKGRLAYRKFVVRAGRLIGVLLLGERKERVRKYGLYYKRLIELKTDIAPIVDQLLDAHFDLAAWVGARDLAQQISAERQVALAKDVPKPAMMQGAQTELGTDIVVPVATLEGNGEPVRLKDLMRIGRHHENDLVLNYKNVSLYHAVIRWQGTAFAIEDLQSKNGTFLNEARLASVAAPTLLTDGDQLQIGPAHLRFNFQAPPSPAPLSSSGLEVAVTEATRVDASAKPLGFLEVNQRRWPLTEAVINIGRDPRATLRLEDTAVSYLHAQLRLHNEQWFVNDLGSRNNTYLNGQIVAVPRALSAQDVIRLGNTYLTFHASTASASAAPSVVEPLKREPTSAFAGPEELQLHIQTGSAAGLVFAIRAPMTDVGRDPDCPVGLQHELRVSWQHARFVRRDKNWFILDLGSSNGTYLNGTRLEPQRETLLPADAEITFGDVIAQLKGEVFNPPASASSLPPTKVLRSSGGLAQLTSTSALIAPVSFELGPGETLCGRAPDNPLVVPHSSVSWQHARLTHAAEGWTLTDLQSTNGTLLNGTKITAEIATPLTDGDTVQLGKVAFKFSVPQLASEPPSEPPPAVSSTHPPVREPDVFTVTQTSIDPIEKPAPAVSSQIETSAPPRSELPRQLVCQQGQLSGAVIGLTALPIVIGKATATSEGVLNDALLSKDHFEIAATEEALLVRDLGSRNGTALNGEALIPHQFYPLKQGDILIAGRTIFKAE